MFANSLDICEYLTLRGDSHISYNHLDIKVVHEARRVRESMVIDKCMSGHEFVYKPNSNSIYKREYLCSCSNCLELKFENCESLITANFDQTVADINRVKMNHS